MRNLFAPVCRCFTFLERFSPRFFFVSSSSWVVISPKTGKLLAQFILRNTFHVHFHRPVARQCKDVFVNVHLLSSRKYEMRKLR